MEEEYFYDFKAALLNAGQEVSNALYDYKAASDKIVIRSKEIYFLQKAVDYTKELMKYDERTNYTDVLTSEQSLLAAQLSGVSTTAYNSSRRWVTLANSSLGGGWR